MHAGLVAAGLALAVTGSGGGAERPVGDFCSDLTFAIDATSQDLSRFRGAYDSLGHNYRSTIQLDPDPSADNCSIDQVLEEDPWDLGCVWMITPVSVEEIRGRSRQRASQVVDCLKASNRKYRIWTSWTETPPGPSVTDYSRRLGGALAVWLVQPKAPGREVFLEVSGNCSQSVALGYVSCFLHLTINQRIED